MPNFMKGIYDYGEYSGNKMLENQQLQRLIETNINAYLATVGGEGARYYGGQAQVMFARFQAERRQSYPCSNTPSPGYLPAYATVMGVVGTEVTQSSQELSEVSVKSDISWGEEFATKMDDWMKPTGMPLSGIEYSLGKALKASDANDMIKSFNQGSLLRNNPYLKTRPVNVHIPGGVRVEIPRNVIKNIGTGLQVFGIASAVVGAASDINKYSNGEISGAHLAVNLVMSAVGFIGPWGAVISIAYSLT